MCQMKISSLVAYDEDAGKTHCEYPGLAHAIQEANKHLGPKSFVQDISKEKSVADSHKESLNLRETVNLLDEIDEPKPQANSKRQKNTHKFVETMSKVSVVNDSETSLSESSSSEDSDEDDNYAAEAKKMSENIRIQEIKKLKLKIETRPSLCELRRLLLCLSNMQMSYEHLQLTRIGVTIAELINHQEYEKLKDLCRALIMQWVNLIPHDVLFEVVNCPV